MDADLRHQIDTVEPAWHRVGSPVFVYAAFVTGRTWALRLNDFPDHPLYTLFVDGQVIGDLDDPPPRWHLRPASGLPVVDPVRRAAVLEPLKALGPYGSEAGQPCDGDWCHCRILTAAYVMDVFPPTGW